MSAAFVHQPHASRGLNQDLSPLPHESILSSLWRFAWRNSLNGQQLLRHCSQRAVFSSALRPLFEEICLDRFALASGWKLGEAELMCGLDDPISWSSQLRYCPVCLEHGYHSYWHQSLHIATCPLDGTPLETTCHYCRNQLPEYGLNRPLLERSYVCPRCHKPIAGVWPSIELRLSFHDRDRELSQVFSPLDHWWGQCRDTRARLRRDLPAYGGEYFHHYEYPYARFMRQWIVEHGGIRVPEQVIARRVPQLIKLRWKVWLEEGASQNALAPSQGHHTRRTMGIYCATLRRLERLIKARAHFTDADYRRHLVVALQHSRTPLHSIDLRLLALCVMRRALEPFLSLDPDRKPKSLRDASRAEISHCWHRARLCWRIAFIGMYVDTYWSLVSSRCDVPQFFAHPSYNPCAMRQVEDATADCRFARFEGSIAFPEIDGIILTPALLGERSAVHESL